MEYECIASMTQHHLVIFKMVQLMFVLELYLAIISIWSLLGQYLHVCV